VEHPRFWRPRTRWLVAGPVALVLIVVWFLTTRFGFSGEALVSAAPVAGAVIALISLVATATSLIGNWSRQRREATIKAWNEWSDHNRESRRTITDCFGKPAMSVEQGTSLVEDEILSDELVRGRRALVDTLNGLERLAVGVEMGVYDLPTLKRLGGTIIVRQYQRAEAYITARRNASDPLGRQATVYESLEYVCGLLRRGSLLDETRKIDEKRLAYLRRKR